MSVGSVSNALIQQIEANRSVLRRGSRGTDVSELQRALAALGFDAGPADGIFGPKTAEAVRQFQRRHGLVVDAVVGSKTWGALRSALDQAAEPTPATPPPASTDPGFVVPNVVLRRGARSNDVKTLQSVLNTLGYPAGTADGIFGPKTQSAVRAFQRDHNLSSDGVVGRRTWAALAAAIAATDIVHDHDDDDDHAHPPLEPLPPPGSGTGGDVDNPITVIPTRTVRNGSRGPEVRLLQQALTGLGYAPGPVDGIFGPKTTAAVKAFQRAQGLSVDGIVGPKTWGALAGVGRPDGPAPIDPIERPPGSANLPVLTRNIRYIKNQIRHGNDVRALQNRLVELGYNLAVDGKFGPGTRDAVRAFQAAAGLPTTGVVGVGTWRALGGPIDAGLASVYPGHPVRLSPLQISEMETFGSWKTSRRPRGVKPLGITWHHTASPHGSGPAVVRGFATSSRKASSDFIVGDDGRIWVLMPNGSHDVIESVEDFATWHAGIGSSWTAPNGRTYTGGDVNRRAVGIEIVNRGLGNEPYPEAQMIAIARLTRWLMDLLDISMGGITTHRDVAPGRKIDPSDNFPMEAALNAVLTGWWDPLDVLEQEDSGPVAAVV